MITLLVLIFLCLVLLVSWLGFIRDTRKFNVKGPTPLPIIGNAHMFIAESSRFLEILHNLKQKYGDAFRAHLLSDAYVVLCHPKYVEPLVSSSELISKGRSYTFIKPWLGEGLLTSSGRRWKSHRKFLTPAFHFNILQNFLPVFCKNAEIFTNKLRDLAGAPVDLFPITALAALDNVTESIMGVSVNAQKNSESEYVKSIEELTQILALRMQVPLISNDFVFSLLLYKRRQDKALSVVHKQTRDVIEARREDLRKSITTNEKKTDELGIKNRHAFLDLLLLGEIDGEKIDDESVREEVDTFMFEGHDTTTSGLVYTLFCISKHPDIQEKIFEEQKMIFGDELEERDPTYTELHQMKYLDLVIKESMRMYPPVPLIERLMVKDVEFGGLRMRAGTHVLINIFEMHRNPDVFEDPLEFRPERFETTSGKNPFSFIAFSAGPRNCIGQRFAMMEMKVTLSSVLRKLKVLPVDRTPKLCADLILRSTNGVYVEFEPRG